MQLIKWVSILLLVIVGCAPVSGSRYNAFAVANRLEKQWPGLTLANTEKPGNIYMADQYYFVPKVEEAKTLIRQGLPRKWYVDASVFGKSQVIEYPVAPMTKDKNDCDKLSARTKTYVQDAYDGEYPLAFGIVDVSGHSMNILVCEELILLYDAQSDIIRSPNDTDKPYFMRF
jgi:hypothetical protein